MKSCAAFCVQQIWICPLFEQLSSYWHVTANRGIHQRSTARLPIVVLGVFTALNIGVSAELQKQLDNFLMLPADCIHEWCVVRVVRDVGVCARIKQNLHDVQAALLCRTLKRSPTIATGPIDVSSCFQELPDRSEVFLPRRNVQWRCTAQPLDIDAIDDLGVDVCATL